MSENGHDVVAEMHRAELERLHREKAKELALIETMFRETRERYRADEQRGQGLMETIHREAADRSTQAPLPPEGPATVPHCELTDLPVDSPIYEEWRTYRRALPHLLADGHAGKFALIKGTEVLGLFNSLDEGVTAGRAQFAMRPFMVQPIREREPLLRIRGYSLPWPN